LTALLVGCHHRQPAISDDDMKLVRAQYPGMSQDCLEEIRWRGVWAPQKSTDQCFRMTKPRQWRGLWLNAFEYSEFCPAPASSCPVPTGEQTWLSGSRSVHLSAYAGQNAARTYAVDFIGRMTADRGHFGHAGLFDREIIVDQLISIRAIEQPEK
jgi:hypothetical protein